MADFDLTQTDAQVQSILNDAQNAQGAGAQTTLTTDYIMLKDTSGNYHKILKDSFTEACRNVLAGLLVNNDKGTTISQIPAIASGDFGSVTPANLASVLGGTPSYDYSLGAGESKDVFSWPSYGVRGGLYLVAEVTGRGYFSLYLLGKGSVTLIKTSSDANNSYLVITSDLQKVTLTNNDSLTLRCLVYAIAYR